MNDEEKAVYAERERLRIADETRKRIAEGRYLLDEAAKDVAQQRGLGELWSLWAPKFEDTMVKAAEAGELTVRDISTQRRIRRGEQIRGTCTVTRSDVNAWLDSEGFGYRWEGEQQSEPAPRPVQRQPAQEAAILAKLAELGFDAQALPAAPAGKPSPAKQAVREALSSYSTNVMDKAWQRLRTAGSIRDA